MSGAPWKKFAAKSEPEKPKVKASGPWDKFSAETGDAMRPTGTAHDGDTFALNNGQNGRLYGVDAFELNQTGRAPDGGVVPLGQQARNALLSYAQPSADVTPIGPMTYGRPVVSLDNGGDAGQAILDQGYGLATPEYLKNDPERYTRYMTAERGARLNHRGAFEGRFQSPSDFRHGGADPWAKPVLSDKPVKDGQVLFWDEPTPFQGLRPDIEAGYVQLTDDPNSTPADALAYAKANGFELAPADVAKFYAARNAGGKPAGGVTYRDKPRVLTDLGDGRLGATVRGFGDPLNLLDEAGAVVDTLGGTNGRENVFSSGRRVADVFANNLEQNRSILANDEAKHPYYRMGGQFASGALIPTASIEGVGFAAARKVLQEGGTRFAAEAAAKAAVRSRFIQAGSLEGAVMGAGAGETWSERGTGALVGSGVGAVLSGAAVVGGQAAGKTVRRFLDARRAGRAASDLDPETGAFGPIHYDLADDYPAALYRLRKDGTGEVPAAIKHPEVGPIDLIWGDGTYGLSKIEKLHPEVVDDLPSIVERLPVVSRPDETGNGKFVLSDDTHRAVVAPDFDGETKRWLVTAYERKGAPGGQVARRDPLLPPGGSEGIGAEADIAPTPAPGNVASPATAAQRFESDDSSVIYGPGEGLPPSRQPDRNDVNDRARPLLADVSDAQRAAQAERIAPGDVLPIPSNTVASMEEAAAVSAGRYPAVKAPNERDALASRSIPSPNDGLRTIPKRGPLDLVTWLRTQGGIRPQGKELEHYGIDNAPRVGTDFAGGENRFGKLVDAENGMYYDEAADAAWKAGYFPDHADTRPTVSEFLDALSQTHSGRNRSFLTEDHPEVDAFEAQRSLRHSVEGARERGAPLVEDRGQPVDMADLDRNAPPVTAYEEWGENAPRLAGNLDLEKLDTPQAIKRALLTTERRVGGFDAATRGRITQAETQRLANEMGMTPQQLLHRQKGQALNAEQALAARQILAKSGNELVNMARKLSKEETPGDEALAEFRKAWMRHAAIQEQIAGATAEAGRALGQFRMVANSRNVKGDVLAALAEGGMGRDRVRQLADVVVENARDPSRVNRLAADAAKPRFRDKLAELYINSLLSGPATHAVNFLSNSMTALGQLPEHAVAAAIGAPRGLLNAQADRVVFSEVGARGLGLLQGTKEGLAQAARTLRTGESPDFGGKIEGQHMKAISGRKGEFLRIPTRLLSASDELFKGMNRRMELTGIAVRRAKLEGLKGDAGRARVAELLENPTDDMLAKAFDYGREMTFQRPLPHGSWSAGISRASQNQPLAKLILPFIKTPVNILSFAAARSPIAPFLKTWRAEFVAGGAARDLAIAKVSVGSGAMALAMEMSSNGQITGGGPVDRDTASIQRSDGWQPYSVKIGERYYSYARLDPFATTLGVAADYADLQSHMSEKEREQVAGLLVASTIHNLADKAWFSGVADLAQAINDPKRYGGQYVRNRVASIAVPALVAQAARAMDPALREAKTTMDVIRSRIPIASRSLAKKLDVWGQPITNEGGVGPDIASPVRTSTARNDPVAKAVLSTGASVSLPNRYVAGRQLSDEEYHSYAEKAGQLAHSRINELVTGPAWESVSTDSRAETIEDIVRGARREAREDLFGKPGKRSAETVGAGPWSAFR